MPAKQKLAEQTDHYVVGLLDIDVFVIIVVIVIVVPVRHGVRARGAQKSDPLV